MSLSQKNFARPSGRPECGGESGNAPVTLSSGGLLVVWGLSSAPTSLADVGKSHLIQSLARQQQSSNGVEGQWTLRMGPPQSLGENGL